MTLHSTGFNLLNGSEVCCSDVKEGCIVSSKNTTSSERDKKRERERERDREKEANIALQSTKERSVYSELKDFWIIPRHCVALARENSSAKCTFIIFKPCEK